MTRRDALEEAHDVIGGIAHQSASQWHAGHFGQGPRRHRQRAAQQRQQLLLTLRHRIALVIDEQALGGQTHFEAITETDE
jgi:hypothetical protein